MKNIEPIVEFILQVEKESKKRLTESEVRQVLGFLLEKIEQLSGGKGFAVKSKSGRILGTHETKEQALKQLAAVEISKMRRGQ